MSKLGKKIILIPKESSIKVEGNILLVSGPKGSKKFYLITKRFQLKQMKKKNLKFHQLIKKTKALQLCGEPIGA
jgi:ribosomal protein L6P/L9E